MFWPTKRDAAHYSLSASRATRGAHSRGGTEFTPHARCAERSSMPSEPAPLSFSNDTPGPTGPPSSVPASAVENNIMTNNRQLAHEESQR